MENNYYSRDYSYGSSSDVAAAFPALMKNVYVWMTMALAVTGLTAFYIASTPDLVYAVLSSRFAFWGLLIAEFAIVMILSSRIHKMSFPVAAGMMAVYSIQRSHLVCHLYCIYTFIHSFHFLYHCRNFCCDGYCRVYDKQGYDENRRCLVHGADRTYNSSCCQYVSRQHGDGLYYIRSGCAYIYRTDSIRCQQDKSDVDAM